MVSVLGIAIMVWGTGLGLLRTRASQAVGWDYVKGLGPSRATSARSGLPQEVGRQGTQMGLRNTVSQGQNAFNIG